MQIRMVDTISQYGKIREEVDQAIKEILESGVYINGPAVAKFRQDLADYLEVGSAIPCANGTDALQVALMALDLKPGDEVITPSFTFVATVEAIALLGLRPVFVDVEYDTFNMDPGKIEQAISPKTKCILPVHLYGLPADMEPIMQIAMRHDLFVIEDNAQAIGADYIFSDGRTEKAGTIGDIGTTSFYPSKNLGAFGDAGALFTNDEDLAKKILMICNHGGLTKYFHECIGVNSRLDNIQAAVLGIKLKYLNDYNYARQKAAQEYNKLLSRVDGILTPAIPSNRKHVFHQYTLRLKDGREKRDTVQKLMADRKIPTMVYYPVPNHRQKAYSALNPGRISLPVTEQLCNEVISLPMHSELDHEQIRFIAGNFLDCYSQA